MTTCASNSSESPTEITKQQARRAFGLLAAAGVGMLLAIQSRINGTLGARLHDGLAAAVISFGTGLLVLIVLTAALPTGRRGLRRVARTVRSDSGLRAYQCMGGVCGGFFVFSQGIAAGVLGVALFTVAAVASQVVSGLVVDRLGLGPAGPQAITAFRVIGAVLAVVAVLVAVSAELTGAHASWLVLLPAAAGIGMAWQQAVNGRVKETAESAVTAAAVNFATGTLALLVAFGARAIVRGLPSEMPGEAWLYVGGALGIVVIGGASALVRWTGVLLLGMGMIAGQLIGALLLDLLVPAPGTQVEVTTVVGVLLTLLAAGVATLRGGRRGGRAAGLPR